MKSTDCWKSMIVLGTILLLLCGCQKSDQPSKQADVQTPASEADLPVAETEAKEVIEEVDEDIELGMQADHFERETENVVPIEKATEVPAGPVIDANKPNE